MLSYDYIGALRGMLLHHELFRSTAAGRGPGVGLGVLS